MQNLSKIALALIALVGISALSANTADAFGGGRGGHRGGGEGRFGLVPQELREEFRADFQNLTDEERAELRAERRAMHEEKRAGFEEFTGLSRDELRDIRRDGGSIGDALTEQGITQDAAETFLTDRANDKVDAIVDRHDLSDDQEQTIRGRVAEFVQNILNRWFS